MLASVTAASVSSKAAQPTLCHRRDIIGRGPLTQETYRSGRRRALAKAVRTQGAGRRYTVLVSHGEIGPARLVGRLPHDGFGLLEIATRGGLGEAARLPSILPPPQPCGRHEDDRAYQADQDEIDSEDQQHPEPHVGHCPHLPPSAPGPHRQEDSQCGSQ
jgi:hypothetical protein